MRYTQLKKQNKALKAIIAILTVALVAVTMALNQYIAYSRNQWNNGFDACIEENNLYNRYN